MKQRGSLTIGLVIALAIASVGCLAAIKWATHEAANAAKIKGQYDAFVANVKAVGDEQERKSKEKDAANAKQIKDAVTERDVALTKLRQSNTRRRELSDAATATAGSGQVCFPTPTYNASVKRYRERLDRGLGGIQPLAIEGDAAQIDAQTLLKGWPK